MTTIRSKRAQAALSAIGIMAATVSVTAMAPAGTARSSAPAAPGRPQVIATIPLGGRLPFNIATDPVTHMVYVTEPLGVTVIDGRTNKVVTTIPIPGKTPAGHPHGQHGILLAILRNIATDPSDGMVYVTDAPHKSVLVISGRTNKVVATVNVGGTSFWIAANPVTHKVYVQVLKPSGNVVAVIDGQTGTVVDQIPEHGPDAAGIAVNPRTDMVYAVSGSKTGTLVIDGQTDTVVATIPGVIAWGAAADPLANTIYIAFPGGEGFGTVYVIDGRTNTVTHSVTVRAPVRIAVDPLTHLAYAANLPDNVVVVNGRTGKVAASVRVGNEPVGIATDPVANRVYVANAVSRTVTVLAGSR